MNQHAYAARQAARYFQFPLCAFAYGRNEKDRLQAIFYFCIVEIGLKIWRKTPREWRQNFIQDVWDRPYLPDDYDQTNERHCIAMCGANVFNIELGEIKNCLANHSALEKFIEAFQIRHGKDALVRLRSDLFFGAMRGDGITPFELSLLAAIYSIIGRKQGPVRISQAYIVCRALGNKSKSVMAAELSNRRDGAKPGAKPFTDWIIRSTIESLQRRRFFARTTYGRRQTYYSHRMTEKQLRRDVYERKTRSFATKRLTQIEDQAMTNAIRNQRAAFQGRPPVAPDAAPFQTEEGASIEDISG